MRVIAIKFAKKSVMDEKKVPVTVYSESTPNPATMKFVANMMFIKNGSTVEYNSPQEAEEAPIAARLFTFPFVKGVFISKNFITVTKTDAVDWMDVTLEMREYLVNYLTAGYPIFNETPEPTNSPATAQEQEGIAEPDPLPTTDQEKRITEILEDYVRPAVESDGGAIDFKSFDGSKLTVTLKGACSGCPSSTITLKNGIQNLFKQMMPEVKEVVAEEL